MKTVFVNMMNDPKDCKTAKEKLAACYTNTGNLVWHDCCKKEIDYEEEVALNDLSKDYENTVLVVPVANNLSVGETEFSKKLRTLLNVNAQIALIGLGAQAGGR